MTGSGGAGDACGRADSQPDGGDTAHDLEVVAELLGRQPAGDFEVVVRTDEGRPAVIANAPFLHDGTPMPTRYWLVDPTLREEVSRLESPVASDRPRTPSPWTGSRRPMLCTPRSVTLSSVPTTGVRGLPGEWGAPVVASSASTPTWPGG